MVRKLASVVACSFAVFVSVNISLLGQDVQFHPDVFNEVNHAVSPPLRAVKTDTFLGSNGRNVVPLRPVTPNEIRQAAPDPVLQTTSGPLVSTSAGQNFDGVSANGYAPPDTNGAVGATQFVQWVNVEFAVYDKSTGALLKGPVAGNALFANLGGACASSNSGDPIAQYDKLANRWVLSQPVFSQPYAICIAVSQTSDATGAYNLYQFNAPNGNFPDYPKFGVWSDAYYGTFNMFSGNRFLGNTACAFNRNAMLNGTAAMMQCFNSGYASLLPSDVDGTTPPPAGEPALFVNFGSNSLNFWKFHVDFANSNNSTFTGPTNIAVAAFSPACGGGTCIPQAGTSQVLDSLADRLMYRFAYRNFGDHESLVVNHSVTAGSSVGVRWYEIRTPSTTPTVFQQGTFAPDSKYRWMGSIAMDHSGDIAVGYSESSSSINPAIYYTGRVPSDASGTMESENLIFAGPGSQSGSNLSRWGDYSSMSVDPTDDCTFWYTNEYLPFTGSFNWNTRIASFKFPTCGQPPKPDFSIGASPTSQSAVQGGNVGYSVTVTSLNSYSGSVTLSTSTLPSGVTSGISPNPVTVPISGSATSTMTLLVANGTAPGSYPVTITGTDGTLTHSTQVTLVVTSTGDFSISATPSSQTISRGSTAIYTVAVTGAGGFSGTVSFTVSGLPPRSSATFTPSSVTGSGNSILSVKTNKRTTSGTYPMTITGTSGSLSSSTPVTLIVQ